MGKSNNCISFFEYCRKVINECGKFLPKKQKEHIVLRLYEEFVKILVVDRKIIRIKNFAMIWISEMNRIHVKKSNRAGFKYLREYTKKGKINLIKWRKKQLEKLNNKKD